MKGLGRDEYWKRVGESLHGGGDEKGWKEGGVFE